MPFAEGAGEGQAVLEAFRQGLNKLGWAEDRNIRIDARWGAGNVERTSAYATELVGLSPDVILAYFNAQLAPISRQTRTIPIVFVGASDPVGAGYVASFARPGGNITGFTLYEPSLAGKWLEILRELVPGIARVAVMVNPHTAILGGTFYSQAFAAASRIMSIVTAKVQSVAEIESAIASLGQQPNSSLIVAPDTFTETHGQLIVSLAARHRVPTVFAIGHFPTTGGLVSYGPNTHDAVRRAASYVNRILRGEKPADRRFKHP